MDMMAQPFKPENFKDHYREALERLIHEKLAGMPIKEEEEAVPKRVSKKAPDLMDSLRRSLRVIEGGKSSKKKTSADTAKRARSAKVLGQSTKHIKILKSSGKASKAHMTVARRRRSNLELVKG